MTRSEAPRRSRHRGFAATALALVVALLALGTPLSASADIVGSGNGTIGGTVTSAGGGAIEGAFVNVSISLGEGTAFSASTYTDAAGQYEFSGLEAGNYSISTSAAGFQNQPWQYATVSAEPSTIVIDFALTPFVTGVGSISGTVTADGVPLAGQSVTASNLATGQNVFALSDQDGRFEITGLTIGQWNVSSWAGQQYQYLIIPSVQLTDAAPSAIVDVPFLSWPVGTSGIGGVVTNAQSGAPLGGTTVSINGITVAQSAYATTDENGAYSFGSLPSGSYGLSVYALGYLNDYREVQVAEGQTLAANLALIPTNSTISGRVTGPNGVGVADLYVSALSITGSNIGSAVTDANGNYVIEGLGAIKYTLSVAGPGTIYVAQERVVTAAANATTVANFKLKLRKTGSLAGFILNPDGSYHPEAVCVTLYSSKSKNPIASTITANEQFGGDGTYGFNDLKPGSYTVKFRDCDGNPATKYKKQYLGGVKKYKNAAFITVVAGQDSYENNFTLVPRSH